MRDKNDARMFTDISFKWRDFRLQDLTEDKEKVNEVIDKRGLGYIADNFVRVLVGNDAAALSTLKNKKLQGVVRNHVSEENFDAAFKILYEELFMALRRAALKIEGLGE